jgi:RND family efflux transporter MFP subunit
MEKPMEWRIAYRLVSAVGGIVLATCSCSPAAAPARAEELSARAVAVAPVKRGDLQRTLELAAEFRPYQEVDLHAKVAGYLKAIYVDVGDQVKAGQLIAVLEAPEMSEEVAQAAATLKRAQVDVERSRSELQRSEAQASIRHVSFDRLSSVLKTRPKLIAQQDIDDARAQMQQADAQLAAGKSAVDASEEQVEIASAAKQRADTLLTYLRISAPFAGTITKRLADPGAMIQAGTASSVQAMPVVQLSQLDHMRLVLPVPESVVPGIRVSAPVEVRVDSLKRVIQGRIARFSGKLDAATRTMDTEVDLANPDGAIKAGMFGYVTLVLDRRENAVAMPVQALASRSAPVKVLVVDASRRLQEREIAIGLETADQVEVTSGLQNGDLVVVGARSNLRPGMLVEPKVQSNSAEGAQ